MRVALIEPFHRRLEADERAAGLRRRYGSGGRCSGRRAGRGTNGEPGLCRRAGTWRAEMAHKEARPWPPSRTALVRTSQVSSVNGLPSSSCQFFLRCGV
jgi:hypothetical protein